MSSVEWVEPALLWEGRKLDTVKRPRLLEFQSDGFMPEFLGALAATNGEMPPADYLKSKVIDVAKPNLKLYQPLHGCFYLVTASLVCRQLGLPDKTVVRKNGEKTGFVIRRYNTVSDGNGKSHQQEEGWVDEGPNKGWQPLRDSRGRATSTRADEERFPLHPVSVCAKSLPDEFGRVVCQERTLYHGYLAAGNREKYIQKLTPPATKPDAVLGNYLQELAAATDALPAGSLDKNFDFRADEFDSRVIAPWQALRAAQASISEKGELDLARKREASLYILLDLADNLVRQLNPLWKALVARDASLLSKRPESETLFRVLDNSELERVLDTGATETISIASVLAELAPVIGLVRGEELALPSAQYDLTNFVARNEDNDLFNVDQSVSNNIFVGIGPSPIPGSPARIDSKLIDYITKALNEDPQPVQSTDEFAALLKDQVKLEAVDPATGKEATYFLRLVYDYDPDCPPIVSQSSQPFRFAKFFEPDAPARHIRIELPSIKMSDMRKYKKGVGLQMSPELRDVMNRIHKGMADGEPLLPGGGSWGLGMICSFSIQIIFLVAFIVMFIFLIMLNIVFWWMAFLKICFPIPVKSGA